jgi:hypothetical protein
MLFKLQIEFFFFQIDTRSSEFAQDPQHINRYTGVEWRDTSWLLLKYLKHVVEVKNIITHMSDYRRGLDW